MASLLNDLSFEQLAAALELREDSQAHVAARAEITIRQMWALLEAAEAQKAAAEAQERAADASARSANAVQRNANYMLASVMVAMAAVLPPVDCQMAPGAHLHFSRSVVEAGARRSA